MNKYKVLKIGAGDTDRFISIMDEQEREIEIFDYSASATFNLSDAFQLIESREYKMKLELFGEVVENDEIKNYGKKIRFVISKKEYVGRYEQYLVQTDLGVFYIPVDEKTKEISKLIDKTGYYNYSRIDLIQVDNKTHPEYKWI